MAWGNWIDPTEYKDSDRLLDGYYELSGWGQKLDLPTEQKLIKLGLSGIAEDLKRHSKLP